MHSYAPQQRCLNRPSKCMNRRCLKVSAVDIPKRTVVVEKPKSKKDEAAAVVSVNLKNASIVLTGANDALLEATCKCMAQRLVYFPVFTKNTLMGTHKVASVPELVEKQGWTSLRQEEADLLKGIADQLKCITATLANGASVEASTYPSMLSSFVIHIEDATAANPSPEELELQRLLSSRAEISVRVEPPAGRGFVQPPPLSIAAKARTCTDLVVQQLHKALQQRPELPELKNEYGVGNGSGKPPLLRALPQDVMEAIEAALQQRQ